jgi:hypothetical protein
MSKYFFYTPRHSCERHFISKSAFDCFQDFLIFASSNRKITHDTQNVLYLNGLNVSVHPTQMSHDEALVEGSLSSEHTHTTLSLVLFKKANNIEHPPSDLVTMVSKELFETLTLRSLLHLCTVCKMRPTAPMLAIALQNSIPSLTGLPMDNPDAGFYIDIAKRFFGPMSTSIYQTTRVYGSLAPNLYFELIDRDNVEAPHESYPSGLVYYTHLVMQGCKAFIHQKKGRDFIKNLILQWLQTPLHPSMVIVYHHLINVLDHALVLRKRTLSPGCHGHFDWNIEQDEHL